MHEFSFRVRLPETDTFGVVYYSNYFIYFDMARLEMLRGLGVTQEYLTDRGLQFYAAQASCKYHASARFDETLKVKSWISEIGRKSVSYRHKILREKNSELIVDGRITDVLVNRKSKPAQLPNELTMKLQPALLLGED